MDENKDKKVFEESKLQNQIKTTKLAIDRSIAAFEEQKYAKIVKQDRFTLLLKTAAVIILISSVAYLGLNKNYFLRAPEKTHIIVASTQKERKKVTLPDGSLVWLNVNSKIIINEDFNQELRELSLAGEAFFDVKHNAEKPFIVKVGDLKTEVLGTKFNIQAYSVNNSVDIALLTGKIAVSVGKEQAVILTPHQTISLDKQTQTLGTINFEETEAKAAWYKGKLVFIDQAFEDVVAVLERNFSLQIRLNSSELKHLKINGNFSLNDNPLTIIEELCRLVDARYKMQEEVIIISKTN